MIVARTSCAIPVGSASVEAGPLHPDRAGTQRDRVMGAGSAGSPQLNMGAQPTEDKPESTAEEQSLRHQANGGSARDNQTSLRARVGPELVMDAAFRGDPCQVVAANGAVADLPVSTWSSPADGADIQLFVDKCTGSTLDVGCGPGRLAGALSSGDHVTMGVDVSAEAVRQTRARGSQATHADVLSDSYDGGGRLWKHIILADGNIGIGGNPARLLQKLANHLGHDGSVLVELDPIEHGFAHDPIRVRTRLFVSEPFIWARVGKHAIADIAQQSGLQVQEILELEDRSVATLVHQHSPAED